MARSSRCRPIPVDDVVDATGAGDLFASGFLLALARGRDLKTALQAGCLAASEVISHIGARPIRDLDELAREEHAARASRPGAARHFLDGVIAGPS